MGSPGAKASSPVPCDSKGAGRRSISPAWKRPRDERSDIGVGPPEPSLDICGEVLCGKCQVPIKKISKVNAKGFVETEWDKCWKPCQLPSDHKEMCNCTAHKGGWSDEEIASRKQEPQTPPSDDDRHGPDVEGEEGPEPKAKRHQGQSSSDNWNWGQSWSSHQDWKTTPSSAWTKEEVQPSDWQSGDHKGETVAWRGQSGGELPSADVEQCDMKKREQLLELHGCYVEGTDKKAKVDEGEESQYRRVRILG